MPNEPLPTWYDPSVDDGSPNQAPHAAEAISRQPKPFRDDMLARLEPPNTGTPYLTRALKKHMPSLLLSDGVAVPDDPEEMRWRLFFAHSQDMLGFRADIFTGGPNEENNPYFPSYQGLRDRWPDGKTMLEGLAALWLNSATQKQLVEFSHPFRSQASKALGVKPLMALLRGPNGNEATRVFADAFDELKGHKIAHKTNAVIRAYCQNAALLAPHDYCFRIYLRSIVPDLQFPSDDLTEAEAKWRTRIMQDFYHVGPALAPYLIADWLFWFWREGQISWFDSYKADSVWLKTLANGTQTRESVLPPEAVADTDAFLAYCKQLRLPPEWIPASLWHIAFYGLPPRLVNEVIWLEEAATGEQLKTSLATSEPSAAIRAVPKRMRPTAQATTGWPQTPLVPEGLSDGDGLPGAIAGEAVDVIPGAVELKDIWVISPVTYSEQQTTDDGRPLTFPVSLVSDGQSYYVGFTSKEMLDNTIDLDEISLHESSLAALCRLYLNVGLSQEVDGVVLDPFSPTQRYLTPGEIKALAAEPQAISSDEDPDGSKAIVPNSLVVADAIKTEDILHMTPLSHIASSVMLATLVRVLQSASITEAWGVCITYTDLRQTWMIAIPTNDPQTFSMVWKRAVEELQQLVENEAAVPDVALCDLRTSELARDFGEPLLTPVQTTTPSPEFSGNDKSSSRERSSGNVFVTTSGRQVSLSRLLMRHTYEGHLEGTAETISKWVRRDIKKYVLGDLPGTNAVAVIDNCENALPPLRWMIEVVSMDAVHTTDPDFSSRLSICWFTDSLPDNLTDVLQKVILEVDYEDSAEDYDMMP